MGLIPECQTDQHRKCANVTCDIARMKTHVMIWTDAEEISENCRSNTELSSQWFSKNYSKARRGQRVSHLCISAEQILSEWFGTGGGAQIGKNAFLKTAHADDQHHHQKIIKNVHPTSLKTPELLRECSNSTTVTSSQTCQLHFTCSNTHLGKEIKKTFLPGVGGACL